MSKQLCLALLALTGCSDRAPSQPEVATSATATPRLVRVVPLRHASAEKLARTLNEYFATTRRWFDARAIEDRERGFCALPFPGEEVRRGPADPSIVADARTNSLVVEVDVEDHENIGRLVELIARLDVEEK